MSFLTKRAIVWLLAGGSALAILIGLYSGALIRGRSTERTAWETQVLKRIKSVRDANSRIDERTIDADLDLIKEEETIRQRWVVRAVPTAPAKGVNVPMPAGEDYPAVGAKSAEVQK